MTDGPSTRIRWEPEGWIADHVTPLWSVDHRDPAAFWAWTMRNLQTLCGPCSAAKTAREAGDRAALKRIAKNAVETLPLFSPRAAP